MNKNGFTLIEILIAVLIGLVVMGAIYGAMSMAQRSSASVERKVVTQQDTRAALDLMALEIRHASFNPRRSTTIWDFSCGSLYPAPNVALKGIQRADTNRIVVLMDLNESGVMGANNEIIGYTYDGVNTISRQTNCGGTMQTILGPALTDADATTAYSTRVVNAAAGIPLFRYFDRLGNDITASVVATPITFIPQIRMIRITIVAETEAVDPITNQAKTMTYSTDVIVRNHVLSP